MKYLLKTHGIMISSIGRCYSYNRLVTEENKQLVGKNYTVYADIINNNTILRILCFQHCFKISNLKKNNLKHGLRLKKKNQVKNYPLSEYFDLLRIGIKMLRVIVLH